MKPWRSPQQRVLRPWAVLPALAVVFLTTAGFEDPRCPETSGRSKVDYVQWLTEQSMLGQATPLARRYAGSGALWRNPYAEPQPRAASARASVWFTAYPAATITAPGESVLATLGDEKLWQLFSDIGIQAMHTGPMKKSGGVRECTFTPTIDGNFDRISFQIDPGFGSEQQYLQLTANARKYGGMIIGDVIPGHTGKGPDFRLAERAVGDYPGIFHMVAIKREDWQMLPAVPAGKDSANLSAAQVDALKAKGYIVGQLPRTIFYEPGVKETDWSATAEVRGVDGEYRRWVYLHYFKEGQPTLNWLDPTQAAQRLLIGDALHSLTVLGEGMLRLDANGFLGIERRPGEQRAWSEGHPLSLTANQIIAGMVRKLGGFTFQELNLTLDDIRDMSQGGADLSYDFVTRPAYHHAIATGDTEFLRLMLAQMRQFNIDPAGLIHALQNHDELTLELVHFWTKYKDDKFTFAGQQMRGSELRDLVRAQLHGKLMGQAAPYNMKASNGISCTTASLIAASLGIKDITQLSATDKQRIQQAHMLLVMYNAMQPGVLAVSGWDMVGALTLPSTSVASMLADGDTRWINRGAYDLLGRNEAATVSAAGLPRAAALYGSLPAQLKQPDSFAAQMQRLLKVRRDLRVNEAQQVAVPAVRAKGLLVMVHQLPQDLGVEVTALNFGATAIDEEVAVPGAVAGAVVSELFNNKVGAAGASVAAGAPGATKIKTAGKLRIKLAPYEGQALLFKMAAIKPAK